MKKYILLTFIFLFIGINNTFSENSYLGNLNYDNNTIECISQSINNISGVKFIPSTNDFNAPLVYNGNYCESHGYFGEYWTDYINQNTNTGCIDDGYVINIKCYDSLNNEQTCNSDGSGWVKYKLQCMYKFDDTQVELNSANLGNKSIVADGQDKNIEISFPLSINNFELGINYIDFTFILQDDTSIDWFTKTKNTLSTSAVVINNYLTDAFSGNVRTITYRLTNGGNLNTIFKSGDQFNFEYKFYNPTEIANDDLTGGDGFIFKTIKYDINFTDGGSINGFFVEDSNNNINIDNSTIPVKLTALIDINNTGELTNSGFIEGKTQTGGITVINNNTSIGITGTGLYLILTGSISNTASKDYFTGTGDIDDGIKKEIDKVALINNFINPLLDGTTYILKTLFVLVDGVGFVDDIIDIRLNQYIKYTVGGKIVTYLAGILNENNLQNFKSLKIFGITNIDTDKQKDLLEYQGNEDVHNLAGKIEKSSLKRDIRMKAMNVVKVIDINESQYIDPQTTIINWGDDDNDDNNGKELGNILYYGELEGKNVELGNGSELTISGRKTIIVRGGNLFIKSNIINNSNSDILGIIVLKDDDGNGGKLYIDTSVQEIDAIIYTDKSIMSYDESYDNGDSDSILKYEVDGNIDSSIMQNQLFILGTVFSENTIGGSRLDPPVCPFYTESISGYICDTIEAQKYDLNYIRAGFSNKYNPLYGNYSTIIKYNSSLQTTPPPLFSN